MSHPDSHWNAPIVASRPWKCTRFPKCVRANREKNNSPRKTRAVIRAATVRERENLAIAETPLAQSRLDDCRVSVVWSFSGGFFFGKKATATPQSCQHDQHGKPRRVTPIVSRMDATIRGERARRPRPPSNHPINAEDRIPKISSAIKGIIMYPTQPIPNMTAKDTRPPDRS